MTAHTPIWVTDLHAEAEREKRLQLALLRGVAESINANRLVVPVFGLLANLGCMLFYLIGPFMVPGMSKKEPFIALGVAAVWGVYGLIYFMMRSKKTGKSVLISEPKMATV